MRELLEQGFEVAVVTDATAAAKIEEGDGYAAALVNFRFIANATWTTAEAVEMINRAEGQITGERRIGEADKARH